MDRPGFKSQEYEFRPCVLTHYITHSNSSFNTGGITVVIFTNSFSGGQGLALESDASRPGF